MALFRRRAPKPPPTPTRPWPPAVAASVTYTVRTGWAVLAELTDADLGWRTLRAGTTIASRAGITHSLYVPAGAEVDAEPSGEPGEPGEPPEGSRPADLDALLAALAEKDILVDRVLRR
jgi:hypothetical protein